MADPYATVSPERRRRVKQARELRAQGLLQREIAERMSLSRGAVSDLLSDPDRRKARARRIVYGGACRVCGKPTDGSRGRSVTPPDLCGEHTTEEKKYWTRDTIVDTFRAFHRDTGRTPSATDAQIQAGAPRIEARMSDERVSEAVAATVKLPNPDSVQREFGSWTTALACAGFQPNKNGGAGHRNGGKAVRQFVVFSKNGSGWVHRGTVEARDNNDAIQRIADAEGVYVAVTAGMWVEKMVAPRTMFAVVNETA